MKIPSAPDNFQDDSVITLAHRPHPTINMELDEELELPASKRRRLEHDSIPSRPTSSRLFAPFRTVGLVSPTPVPFTSVPLGTSTFQITTSVGRSLHTYDLRRGLNLVFLSRPQCPDTITAIHAYRDRIFVAWGGTTAEAPRGIWVVKRGQVVGELEYEDVTVQPITDIAVFGNWIVACGPKAIEVWQSTTYTHYTTIFASSKISSGDQPVFSSRLSTLPTFLNKVLIGCHDGMVRIYNISTGRLVHSINPPHAASGAVTAIAPAPAVGILAVAYANGSVVILNAENEEVVMQLGQEVPAHPITSMTFRTDGAGAGEDGRQDGIMATSCLQNGDVTIWDLNRGGKVAGVLRGAHEITSSSQASGINKIEFLPGQPIIVSTGLDNSLRTWIFDQSPFSPIPRPLHSRSGHAAPITQLQFLSSASDGSESAGKWLLSAGQDRSLWGFSLRKDGQSSELSQGNIKHKAKKLGGLAQASSSVEDFKAPPITAIACSLNRDGGMGAVGGPIWTNSKASNAEESNMTGWESVITAHAGDSFARTWFWGRKRAGRWAFETSDRKPVSSVTITTCGTFALLGSSGGSLDMYNLQSGMHRQRFPPRLTPAQAKQLKQQQAESGELIQPVRGHSDAITGIVADSLNRTAVSTSLDGAIIFWDFASGNITHKVLLESASPTAVRYNSVSSLISVACDDSCIRVIDVDTKRTVRELWGCAGQIYDHCFSHDGRWIVASSMDSVIRIFDLATGHLIDAFKTATCTNVAFSSTGEYLATAHAGNIGINIWNNKTLYMNISSRRIHEETDVIDLTTTIEFEAASQLVIKDNDVTMNGDINLINDDTKSDQLNDELLTLSRMPPSKWQTLLNLTTIRERNKPVQPPEKPKAAPFFLGMSTKTGNPIQGAQQSITDMSQQVSMEIDEGERSRISRLSSFGPATTTMSNLVQQFMTNGQSDPEPMIQYLTSLSPSAADLEIRSLTLEEMVPFIHTLTLRLRQRRDFELVNTWMSVFLRLHSEFVSEVDGIRAAVLEFKTIMSEEEERLSKLVGWSRGVVDYLRSAR